MVRMKGLRQIYDEAIQMGWWTETPVAQISFGESRLDVVIFKGPDGIQVQGYDRLQPPLPEAFPKFDRISQPFNIMQMIKNRENSRKFFVDLLGFEEGVWYPEQPVVRAGHELREGEGDQETAKLARIGQVGAEGDDEEERVARLR